MRHLIRSVAASALAAALFVTASAAPSTSHLDDLRIYMQTAYDAILPNASENEVLAREYLARGLAALDAKSTSLQGDVRILVKVAAAIDRSVLRPDSSDLLQQAMFAFRDDAVPLRDALAARIDGLVSTKLAAAAQSNLADIDASLNSSTTGVGGWANSAQALSFALKTIATTNAQISRGTAPRGSALRPGVGYFACLADDAAYRPTFGSGRVKYFAMFVSEITLTGYFASAAKGGIEISWSTGSFTGPGVYPLDGTSGAFVVLNQGGQTYYSDATGGQVTVTGFDPVTKRITGTFDAQLVGAGDLGGTRTLTKGSFDVRHYAVSGK